MYNCFSLSIQSFTHHTHIPLLQFLYFRTGYYQRFKPKNNHWSSVIITCSITSNRSVKNSNRSIENSNSSTKSSNRSIKSCKLSKISVEKLLVLKFFRPNQVLESRINDTKMIEKIDTSIKIDPTRIATSIKTDPTRIDTSIKTDPTRIDTSIKTDPTRIDTSIKFSKGMKSYLVIQQLLFVASFLFLSCWIKPCLALQASPIPK